MDSFNFYYESFDENSKIDSFPSTYNSIDTLMSKTFLSLPQETISEIAYCLPYRDVFHLAVSCKDVMNTLVKYKMIKGVLASYSLSVEQLDVVERLRRASVDLLILQAPPSMGKTSMILEYLLGKSSSLEELYRQEKGVGMVIVPKNLYNSWLKEIRQSFPSFLDEERPEASTILLYNIHYEKHHNYVKERQSKKVRLILSSYDKKDGFYEDLLDYPFLRELVFDEAQNKTKIKTVGRFPRILMSANHIGGVKGSNVTTERIILTHEVIRSVIPESTERMTTDSLSSTIEEMLRKHSKIVVFLNKKGDRKLLARTYGENVGIFLFETKESMNLIAEFNKYEGKAILVGTLRMLGTGHNLCGDACIVYQAHNTSSAMILQAKSRLLRISNPNENVDTVFVVESKEMLATGRLRIAMARLLENKYYANLHNYRNGWHGGHQKTREKAFVKYGLVNSLSDMPDICVVFYYWADEFFLDHRLHKYVQDKAKELIGSGFFDVEIWKKMAALLHNSNKPDVYIWGSIVPVRGQINLNIFDRYFF